MADKYSDDCAAVLLSLEDLGIGDGIIETDLLSGTREPLRSCCRRLARQLWALIASRDVTLARKVCSIITAIGRSAATEKSAKNLEDGLSNLCKVLGMVLAVDLDEKRTRLDSITYLVAIVQALALQSVKSPVVPDPVHNEEGLATRSSSKEQGDQAFSDALRKLAHLLGPSKSFTSSIELLDDSEKRIKSLVGKIPAEFDRPILSDQLNLQDNKKAACLHEITCALQAEQLMRRRMLLERAKVTLESFAWSRNITEGEPLAVALAKAKLRLDDLEKVQVSILPDLSSTTLRDFMAILNQRTGSYTTQKGSTSLKSVLIGSVPDRGGRTQSKRSGAEMPKWSDRKKSNKG
jgi:hypothetical protein